AATASAVYAGVLYDAAQMAQWDAATLAFAQSRLRVTSALWGAISPSCSIPAYRLSMGASLGRLGGLARVWRPALDRALGIRDDAVVIDCRSAPYVAAWRPRADRLVTVRVMADDHGRRTVVTHLAKHTRGVFVGRVMRARVELESPAHVLSVAQDL